jgi:triosephosphate isomerase
MRNRVLAANWKMNLTSAEIEAYFERFRDGLSIDPGMEVLFFVPFPYLLPVGKMLAGVPYTGFGAQNLFWEPSGAYTGETSAAMIRDTGADRVLVGHSERRKYFGETDETVNRRLRAALAASLRPILCLGETWEEREAGRTAEVTERSLVEGIRGIDPGELRGLSIAYEPVWAIGTGHNATPEQAQEVHAALRARLGKEAGGELAERIPILYGGSANPGNTADLMAQPDIDGLLVGGASLDPGRFREMLASAQDTAADPSQ